MIKTSLSAGLTLSLALVASTIPSVSQACGGFFCTTIPINQAAEQIVFRQEPGMVTAMVRIQYSGNAEDFSWVVPVPDTPELSVGSDLTFNDLEQSTRPRFNLSINGGVCSQDNPNFALAPDALGAPVAESADSGVVIEQETEVGPFDVQVVSSDNPDDMSIWLADNGYLITDRGDELLAPYINLGMKFVALKLRSGETAGSIQPLIMKYPSDRPMVPIRLTAIAAEDDMGVLVYVVNDQLGRAIPDNYLHVIPNLTKLDWFNGSFNAYASYQNLVTDAMDEAGGQGFATDFAGTITSEISSGFSRILFFGTSFEQLSEIENDAEFLSMSLSSTTNFSRAVDNLQNFLPLPDGLTVDLYFSPTRLASVFTAQELATARAGMNEYFVTREIEPLQNSVELVPEGAYLTRLFTTLSADEMTLDPTFNYNTTMPDQSPVREATVNASCTNEVSNWTLTLGAGTGREGEVVLDVTGEPIPGFGIGIPTPIDDQPAAFAQQRTSADAEPETLVQAVFSPMMINADGSVEGGLMNIVNTIDDTQMEMQTETGTETEEVAESGIDSLSPVASTGSSGGFFGATGYSIIALIGFVLFRLRRTFGFILSERISGKR